METINIEILLAALLGLFVWSSYKFLKWALKRLDKNDKRDSGLKTTNQDYGDFLEIPLEKIVAQQPTTERKDLRALARKINSFKSRNFFYRDIDLTIGKDIDDFIDIH